MQRQPAPVKTLFHIYDGADRPLVHTNLYTVLTAGRFGPRELRLHILGKRTLPAGKIRRTLERAWKAAVQDAEAHGGKLFNGKLFSLQQVGLHGRRLDLLLGETDYRELVGTNYALPGCPEPHGEMPLADGLAVSGVVTTTDGYVLLGRRSDRVHADRGRLHVCGGHPDPDALVVPEEILTYRNFLFTAMRHELQEEFHLSADDVSGMVCLGLIRHADTRKPELIFEITVRCTREEVRKLYEGAVDRDEHCELLFVPSAGDALRDCLEKQYQDFTVPGLAATLFYGMARGFWTLLG
jgi:hypothetical protein